MADLLSDVDLSCIVANGLRGVRALGDNMVVSRKIAETVRERERETKKI